MLKFNFINSTNFNFFSNFNISNVFVGTSDATFSSFVLFSLLLASLGLTFHNKGTTVHKVLGLLLTSIFVVFLWILQSQFLFIYIVYILAFISAVLMLFLSVVLMLPISTLTSKNVLTDQKNKFNFIIAVFSFENYTLLDATVIFILAVVYLVFLCSKFNFYIAKKTYKDLVEYSKYYFKVNDQISSSNYFFNKVINNTSTNNMRNIFNSSNTLSLSLNKSLINLIYQKYMQFGFKAWNIVSLQSSNVVKCFILFFTLINLSVILTLQNIFLIFKTLQRFVQVSIQFTKINIILPQNTFKTFCDILAQTYLFVSVMLSMVSLFLRKQILLSNNANTLNNETLQGLGQLKILLYGDFSLFLLFSTFVLLIALLGAAVMTRSKR